MNAAQAGELESRYRRLLTWYPADYRRNYGEEMIGVLLASSPQGQRRPGIAATIDLVGGAIKVRLRAVVARLRHVLIASPDPGWRDALAVSSLVAPLLLAMLLLGQDMGWMAGLLWHSWNGATGFARPLWPLAVLLLPLALGLARLRRTAALATVALIAWMTSQAALGHGLQEPRLAAYLVLMGVEALALATSPGPWHGLRLISGKAVLMALPWLATTAYAAGIIPTHYPVPDVVAEIGIGLVGVAALPALRQAGGLRLLVLLVVIPGSAFAVSLMTFASVSFYSLSFARSQLALYLPPVVLAGLTATAISRSDRQLPMTASAGGAA